MIDHTARPIEAVSHSPPEGARLGRTESICPRCRRVLDAELVVRGGRVVLSRTCTEHGAFEAVVYGDAKRYLEIQRFDKPGEEPLERQTEVERGCSPRLRDLSRARPAHK